MKRLDLVVGPNGAGKSTFVELTLAPLLPGSAFVNADEIAKLIEPGRVHRRVYTDPEVFELEMERIFGRAWLFVGHTSQVPNPGDFITTDLGRQPVIMVRHRDGSVQVLLNRCTHRGAKVVNERRGHAPRLTCCCACSPRRRSGSGTPTCWTC